MKTSPPPNHEEVRCSQMLESDIDNKHAGEPRTCCICIGHNCPEAIAALASPTKAKTPNEPKPACSALWAVMKAHAWDSITAHGFPLQCPTEGPHKFIPVFNSREQAVAWAGSDEHVAMLMPNEPLTQ